MTSHRMLTGNIAGAVAFAAIALIASARADTVAEWKFDPKADLAGGASVPIDTVHAGASAESSLMPLTTCSSATTGIGDKWQSFLGAGYLDVASGGGEKAKNQHGLVTKSPAGADDKAGNGFYKNYFGFSGYGKGDKGGTAYFVVCPKDNWVASAGRHGLLGSGHQGDGTLSIFVKAGAMVVKTVAKVGGVQQSADSRATVKWDPAKWYFIGASWQEGSAPVMYVREMNVAGPAASPAAIVGAATGTTPGSGQPAHDPISIGAQWVNTGSEAFTTDGADARIAYARIDNVYTPTTGMDAVFTQLGAAK